MKNWQDAEAHCVKEQGHLASFHTQEELSFLVGEHLGIIQPRNDDTIKCGCR